MPKISTALALAIQHHQGGRLQAAEQIYRQVLAIEPNQVDAIHLLGVLAHQMGKHEVAVEHIARAIRLKSSEAAFHNNLGEAYRAWGKTSEAVASYRRALKLKPGYAEASYNLGNALRDLGKLDEAIACFRRTLELKPDYAEAHNNLAVALKDQGKAEEALASYRRAVELKPNYAEAHNNLAIALKDQGKAEEAVAFYRRALELKPDYAEAHNNLGNALEELGQSDAALACYRRALELKPDYAQAHSNLGNALKERGRLDEAMTCYRRALDSKPNYAVAHYNLGCVLEESGDLSGAETSFRAALQNDRRFAAAHKKLADLLRGKLPQQDMAAQRQLLDDTRLTDAQRLLLHFGLAQVLDARGEYAEAAQHLERANALQLSDWQARGRKYNLPGHELFVSRMMGVCMPSFLARVRDFGLDSELPVFVVGLPRSGTTLIEQILASHSQIFGTGELKLANNTMAALDEDGTSSFEGLRHLEHATARRLASRHLEELQAFSPTALRIVDKMPDNYLFLGLLAILFPRARFIHCRRDLRDVAVSCWMTHFPEIRWANDQRHIASRFHQYLRMMEHWRTVLPAPMLEVDYEETVADLEGVARRLVDWCGLEWEPGCLAFHQGKRVVRTASVVQVRQPVFRTSVARWKHYEHALGPLFARLGSTP